MMVIKEVVLKWFKQLLIKKTSAGVATLGNISAVKNENMSNKELAKELQTNN